MVVLFVLLAAAITALGNLVIRRGLDAVVGAKGDPFIATRFLTAACVTSLVIFFRHGEMAFSPQMLLAGAVSGLVLGGLQFTLGRSLFFGPPALSFIFVSAACVVPPIVMYFIFGQEFGHSLTIANLIGSSLVLLGLIWMAKGHTTEAMSNSKQWLFWIFLAFSCGILYQLSFQWRALVLKEGLPAHSLIPFHCTEAEGDCFLISMFLAAALCQKLFTLGMPSVTISSKALAVCGLFGGILNGISGFILMRAAEIAITDLDKAIVFPLFTVILITLCNSWAKLLYHEKVNWKANALCMVGIAVATG